MGFHNITLKSVPEHLRVFLDPKTRKTSNDNDTVTLARNDDEGFYQFNDKDNHGHSVNDMPARVYDNGDMIWMQHGVPTRDNDRPAFIGAPTSENAGVAYFYRDGIPHREHGVTMFLGDGGYIRIRDGVITGVSDEEPGLRLPSPETHNGLAFLYAGGIRVGVAHDMSKLEYDFTVFADPELEALMQPQ